MSRAILVLCAATIAAVGATAWAMLRVGDDDDVGVPTSGAEPAKAPDSLAIALRDARRTCDVTALDAVVARLRDAAAAAPDDARSWHLLAEAHLERSLARSHDRGLAVGAPAFPELPKELAADLDAGLAAAARARQLGDDSGDLFRIEAGLMSQHIVGLASALQWNGKIHDALRRSGELAPDNPHLHVALGLRRLLAPKLLGHDPVKALEHFEFAAKALADDERPSVFAAMASYLQQKRQQAIVWLEQAVARNPKNRFARVVLGRLRAGEAEPFARAITAAEAAAIR
jgi:cytochrome c-type biogenesis protein CcmH/NrfG